MKATGIVRRIDDLGRVVIPKEIRRTMRIREGDPLEIYTDREGEVIFKKYSPIGELAGFATQYADTLHKTGDINVVICDRDTVIASAGLPKKEFMEKPISLSMEKAMEDRSTYVYSGQSHFEVTREGGDSYYVSCLTPIITEGDVIGCVASLFPSDKIGRHKPSEVETKLIQTASGFLAL